MITKSRINRAQIMGLLLPGLLGLSGVAMSQPAADLLTFLVSIPFQIWFFRHKLRG